MSETENDRFDKAPKHVGRATPEARVYMYLKDKVAGDSTGERVFVEVLGFRNVTTNLTMKGTGTASITFENFNSGRMRYVSKNTVDSSRTPGDTDRNNELGQVYFDAVMNDYDGIYDKLWDYATVFRGDKTLGIDRTPETPFDQWSRSRAELAAKKSEILADNKIPAFGVRTHTSVKDQIKNTYPYGDGDGSLLFIIPFVDLFDSVFVDYKGQDGLWYAGFTGLVTQISDNFSLLGDQSLTINCKDATVLLDNVSVVSAWNRLSVQEANTPLADFAYNSEINVKAGQAAFTDYFAGNFNSVRAIIAKVVDVSQQMWQMPETPDTTGIKTVGFNINPIFKYDGVSGRRLQTATKADINISDTPEGDTIGEMTLNPENFSEDFELTEQDYIYDRPIFLDPLLYDMDNLFIHKLLNNSLSLYKDSMKSADAILNNLVAQMFAYKYIDANGNMIIELPRYNAMPNLDKYAGRSYASVLRHKAEPVELYSKTYKVLPDGTDTLYNQSSIRKQVGVEENIKWYTVDFHGKNYVISSDDLISFNTAIDESAIMTVATVKGTPPLLSGYPEDIFNTSKDVQAVATSDISLLAKLGVRRYAIQNLYNVQWRDAEDSNKIMSYLASVILERVNAQADSGTVQLSHRPDIQLGRTIVNPLRWKSYLIQGVTNSWSMGGPHTTTLQVSYGHPIHKTLDYPWSALKAEPHVFVDSTALAKTRSLDKNGQIVPDITKKQGSDETTFKPINA